MNLFVLALILFCEHNLYAQNTDVNCVPDHAWDTGYQVRLIRAQDGSYDGALDQLALSGRKARYRGKVEVSKVSIDPAEVVSDCLVKVVATTENGLPFEIQIPINANSELISVAHQPVKEHIRELKCHFSDQFLADQKAICQQSAEPKSGTASVSTGSY